MESLKTLLKSQGISLNTEKAINGQLGHSESKKVYDQEESKNSLIQQNKGGCRLVWFRTLAFQANDPGFKSRRPHHFSNYLLLIGRLIYYSSIKAIIIFLYRYFLDINHFTASCRLEMATLSYNGRKLQIMFR